MLKISRSTLKMTDIGNMCIMNAETNAYIIHKNNDITCVADV